ncbi:hypothetical protein [Halobacteriovorax sp.]|uniref:hypothetical protein n=1 Tax=Halobacteriovorax sp. TaxID=2020862 RepID=UPI0035654065
MEEVAYHVNLNYELFLSGSNKQIKGASWFDHIFFFINNNPNAILRSDYEFSQDYLTHINSLGVSSIKITRSGRSLPWWGACTDLQKEKFFNSKITMTELGLKEGWIPVASTASIDSAMKNLNYPIISREEWGVSGRGIKILKSEEDFKLVRKESVYSEFVNKYKDYGVTFDLENDTHFIIENYIDDLGQFKGGEVKSISESFGEDNFLKILKIKNRLEELGAVNTIQIDTFLYEGGFHPFVEVNYRKTMGLMIQSLSKRFKYNFSYWGILSLKKSRKFSEVLDILEQFHIKAVLLSPVDRFISIVLLNEEAIDGRKTLKDLEIFISKF